MPVFKIRSAVTELFTVVLFRKTKELAKTSINNYIIVSSYLVLALNSLGIEYLQLI